MDLLIRKDLAHVYGVCDSQCSKYTNRDLETILEVGTWSFTWMGPPLDQLSFLLLCLAYSRNQVCRAACSLSAELYGS